LNCLYCSEDIFFNNGERIPRESSTGLIHNCPNIREKKKVFCKDCGKEIFFDSKIVSKYGKHIPLTAASGGKHRCSAKPGFNKHTRRKWWEEQNAKAEAERAHKREKQRRYEEELSKQRQYNYHQEQQKQQRQRQQQREYEEYKRRSEEEYRKKQQQRSLWNTSSAKQREYASILGVSLNATEQAIKQAYRKLILQYHPDRNNNSDASTEMSKKINEAYTNFNLNAK